MSAIGAREPTCSDCATQVTGITRKIRSRGTRQGYWGRTAGNPRGIDWATVCTDIGNAEIGSCDAGKVSARWRTVNRERVGRRTKWAIGAVEEVVVVADYCHWWAWAVEPIRLNGSAGNAGVVGGEVVAVVAGSSDWTRVAGDPIRLDSGAGTTVSWVEIITWGTWCCYRVACTSHPVGVDSGAKEANSILKERTRLAGKCIRIISTSAPSWVTDCTCNTCIINAKIVTWLTCEGVSAIACSPCWIRDSTVCTGSAIDVVAWSTTS